MQKHAGSQAAMIKHVCKDVSKGTPMLLIVVINGVNGIYGTSVQMNEARD